MQSDREGNAMGAQCIHGYARPCAYCEALGADEVARIKDHQRGEGNAMGAEGVTRIARSDWRDLVKHGYASKDADGTCRALTYDPESGATVLVPVVVVPDAILYREGKP